MKAHQTHMSSKGQIVVPREVREKRGWRGGTALEFVETPRGLLLRETTDVDAVSIDTLVGCINYTGPKHGVAEMDRAVLAEARRRGAR